MSRRYGQGVGTEDLYPRQFQVAWLLAAGVSRGKISERLGLSKHSVTHYLKTGYAVLGVHTAVEMRQVMEREGAL